MRILSVLFIATLFCLLSACGSSHSHPALRDNTATGGKLSSFTEPYRNADAKKTTYTPHTYEPPGHFDRSSDYSGYEENNFPGDLFSQLFIEPFFGDHGYRYSCPPYHNEHKTMGGIYIHSENIIEGNPIAFQFRTYYQPIQHDITSYGFYAKFLFPSSMTIDLNNAHYLEKISSGYNDSINYFTLHFNSAAFTVDTDTTLEIGAGLASLTDVNDNSYNSASAQLKISYFPRDPWSFQVAGSYAAPSNRSIFGLETTIGYHYGILELFLGYHSLINSRAEKLDGPLFGCALWF